jgi:hypothetical protein
MKPRQYKTIPAEARCQTAVWESGGFHSHQCYKKAWKDGYCKVHHPENVKIRRTCAEERYKKQWESSAPYQLSKAGERIKELEAEVVELKKKLQEKP